MILKQLQWIKVAFIKQIINIILHVVSSFSTLLIFVAYEEQIIRFYDVILIKKCKNKKESRILRGFYIEQYLYKNIDLVFAEKKSKLLWETNRLAFTTVAKYESRDAAHTEQKSGEGGGL